MSVAVALGVRYLLVSLFFPFSALDKLLNFKGATDQAQQLTKARGPAMALIVVGLAVEVLMPLGILTGVADRLCAFVMAGYCATTALLWKPWWRPGDFWAGGDSKARNLFWDFMKNLSLAGGFLLITAGLHAGDAAAFLRDPLASSHPYAAQASQAQVQP